MDNKPALNPDVAARRRRLIHAMGTIAALLLAVISNILHASYGTPRLVVAPSAPVAVDTSIGDAGAPPPVIVPPHGGVGRAMPPGYYSMPLTADLPLVLSGTNVMGINNATDAGPGAMAPLDKAQHDSYFGNGPITLDTTDNTTTVLASVDIPAGVTTYIHAVVHANLVGDGTNPNPAPSVFHRFAYVSRTWPGFASSGAVLASDGSLSSTTTPFDPGTAPFHTNIQGGVMLHLSSNTLQIKVRGFGGAMATWSNGLAILTGDFVHNGSNVYFALSDGNTAVDAGGPTGTGSNIADHDVAWTYVEPFASGITVRWTLVSLVVYSA